MLTCMDIEPGRATDADTLVFINYRSDDGSATAALIHSVLSERFGPESVFLDYESIPPGHDFGPLLLERVARSAVLLVVIGRRWLDEKDGKRPIDNPDNWVRKEILTALDYDVPVLPVLFEGATIAGEDLPNGMTVMSNLQYFGLHPYELHTRLRMDIKGLGQYLIDHIPRLHERFGLKTWTVAQFDRPIELGVHPAMDYAEGTVPPYVPREVDESVRGALRAHRHVLLIGESTAGKSRTAYEAMRAELSDHVLVAPIDAHELSSALVELTRTQVPHVLWLDNLHRHLGSSSLIAQAIRELPQSVVIIATIGSRHHRDYTENLEQKATSDPDRWRDLQLAADTMKAFLKVPLARRWSAQELDRAAEQADRRLRRAASHGDRYGVAEYIAAGPHLAQKWRDGWSPGTHPRGAALVAAAIDLHRAGISTAVPVNVLTDLHEVYLRARGGAQLRPEPFEKALEWAAALEHGATSLLIPDDDDQYRPFDYLVEEAGNDVDGSDIPTEVWDAVLVHADDSDLMSVIVHAAIQNRMDHAVRAFDRRDAGHVKGRLIAFSSDDEEEKGVIIRRMMIAAEGRIIYDGDDSTALALSEAESGTAEWNHAVGFHHIKSDELDQAEEYLRRAAEAGHLEAQHNLAVLLLVQSRAEEARDWVAKVNQTEYREGQHLLGLLHWRLGEFSEAANVFEENVDLVADLIATDLARGLMNRGDHDRARLWLRRAHEHGTARATFLLGESHDQTDDLAEAEHWWRLAWERGSVDAAIRLGETHLSRQEWEEAEPFVRAAAEAQRGSAAHYLGLIQFKRQQYDDAVYWLRNAVSTGQDDSRLLLGAALVEKGTLADLHEAEPLLLEGLTTNEAAAAYYLARLHDQRGNTTEAERWARQALSAGNDDALQFLGAILLTQQRYDEARDVLLPAHEAGNAGATYNLGVISAEQGDPKAAINYFTQAKNAGVVEAAADLDTIARKLAEAAPRKRQRFWPRRRS
jgi:uncharacterized protein